MCEGKAHRNIYNDEIEVSATLAIVRIKTEQRTWEVSEGTHALHETLLLFPCLALHEGLPYPLISIRAPHVLILLVAVRATRVPRTHATVGGLRV